jgi:vanillate O-demethylase monooxygenase subunit
MQQKNLLAHPERALLMLNIDAGGVQARKILECLVVAERAATTATTTTTPLTTGAPA